MAGGVSWSRRRPGEKRAGQEPSNLSPSWPLAQVGRCLPLGGPGPGVWGQGTRETKREILLRPPGAGGDPSSGEGACGGGSARQSPAQKPHAWDSAVGGHALRAEGWARGFGILIRGTLAPFASAQQTWFGLRRGWAFP